MSLFQRIILALLPASWAKAAEAESRSWMIRCPHCAHVRSVWDAGGIRWRGRGNPRTFLRCQNCGKRGWHKVEQRAN
jgi:hypothetical protein